MGILRTLVLTATAAGTLAAGGCGDRPPLPLEEVGGTISYDDGSLIEADQIRIAFEPQNVEAKGKVAPRTAETYADVVTGTFGDLTTWKYGDGALVGHHKVVVIALRLNQRGMGEPTEAVPARYQQAETTPLEVDVVDGGKNDFELVIEKRS